MYLLGKSDPDNLTVKRPGTGYFHASKLDDLFGKKANNNIKKDTQLKKEDVR